MLVEKDFLFNVEYFRANSAGPIFLIFIAIERRDAKLFKRFELNFVVTTVSEPVHRKSCKILVKQAKSPEVPRSSHE